MLKPQNTFNLVKVHLWTLPRWFAAPFFGMAAIVGALQAGGMTANSWLAVLASLLIMAGGHSFNSLLDYAWTGLDKGLPGERSAEKEYSRAQNLLANDILGLKAVLINALMWYFLGILVLFYLAWQTGWIILLLGFLGMLVTFWYSQSKFNWTHELALGIGIGPLPALVGMFATSPHPPWIQGILVGIPFGLVISFAGLALDEWPDAETNLKKGVKSIVYKVWEYAIPLEWYLSSWLSIVLIYQLFLIIIGVFKPLTGLSLLTAPFFLAFFVLLKRDFTKTTRLILLTAAFYFVFLTLGQALGN